MIQTPTACPNSDRWQALLAESAGADTAGLEAHLAGCPRCRGLLDELAVGSSGWLRDAGRLAADTDNDDPELTKSVHRIYDVVTDADPDIPLDFLKPSTVPGTIGQLGRYQVLAVLGRGATGIVLKALDPDLLRPVAVKVMLPYLATNGTARQRFQREARAAAAVSHDHVVTIHQVDQLDGLQFLVMEYVAGGSLQARLDADGPMDPREVARIGLQAANGLAAAHAVGLIHRDVKPANILLENGVGRVKLTDFGLARAADDVRLTQTGVAAGTPLYMSPEQARGEVIDHRSDLFSLGSVLYALLTGMPPFRATTTMGVLNRISNEAPRPIRATTPDVPADLEAIIMQLLEKDPAKRFHYAAEVSVRLSGFLAAPPPPPPAPPQPTTGRRRPRPKWWHTALPILAGILMVAVVLKFRTSQGTLVVEVDDPNVKVALNGDELTITGAGPQEVRLKPGSYTMTTSKDGKTVSEEVVTISRGDKTIVRVRAEPAAGGPSSAKVKPVETIRMIPPTAWIDTKVKVAIPDALANRVQLMRMAWQNRGMIPDWLPKGPGTHPSFQRLQDLLAEAEKTETPPDRVTAALKEAYAMAGTILTDTAAAPKAGPAPSGVDTLAKRFQDEIGRLSKTSVGVLVLTPGPVVDLDRAAAGFGGEEATRVKRLIARRDQIAILLPRLQVLEHQAEKAALEARTKRVKNEAGTIPNTELEAAEIDLKAAERALRTASDSLARAVDDFEKEAAEFHKPGNGISPAADAEYKKQVAEYQALEAEYKKLTDEYDALTVRLAKTEVGRLLATLKPGYGWGDAELQNALGSDKAKVDRGRRMLKLRDQIQEQSLAAKQTRLNSQQWANTLADIRSGKEKAGTNMNLEFMAESVRDNVQKAKFHTEALRGMVGDFRKVADDIDPPLSPERKREMEEDHLPLPAEKGPPPGTVAPKSKNPSKQFELD